MVGLIDTNGTQVVSYVYDAWGRAVSVTGSMSSTAGALNPFRYRGYEYDTESGLYYLNSRYYDPTTMRFVNADGLVSTGQGLIGANMFAYCLNNPVMFSDMDGTCPYSGSVADFHRLEHGLAPLGCTCSKSNKLSFSDFKNSDGSYSLYDNKRHNPDSVFHEQILSAKITKPNVSLKNGKLTLGSYKATLMTGGWEFEHVDLSLLDFGSAKIAAGINDDQFELAALATIWDPSITFKLGGVNISLTANVGSIGGDFNVGKKSFKAAGAFGFGAGLSVNWE